jgi:hypothetical protein
MIQFGYVGVGGYGYAMQFIKSTSIRSLEPTHLMYNFNPESHIQRYPPCKCSHYANAPQTPQTPFLSPTLEQYNSSAPEIPHAPLKRRPRTLNKTQRRRNTQFPRHSNKTRRIKLCLHKHQLYRHTRVCLVENAVIGLEFRWDILDFIVQMDQLDYTYKSAAPRHGGSY